MLIGVDGCTSMSGIKSWLRQNTALRLDKQTGQSCLTLSMGQGLQFDKVASASNKVVPADEFTIHTAEATDKSNEKLVQRALVPKKAHFGHRTSQHRGVTR
jgi:hypothetical protein